MPLPDRDASNYRGHRARRQYRRYLTRRPTEQEQNPFWGGAAHRVDSASKERRNEERPTGVLWLLVVLAIMVFTFICLILVLIGGRWLFGGL
jgi:hypothetical protein